MRRGLFSAFLVLLLPLVSTSLGSTETRTGSATISSFSRYEALGKTVYFIYVGSILFTAEKEGFPCKGFFTGDRVSASYDESMITLRKDSNSCLLSITSSGL